MSDHPDTITVAKCHPFRGDNFYIASFGSDRSGTEYVRAEVSAARIADLERQLAEREAQVERLLEMQTDREVDHERRLAEAREVKPLEWDEWDGGLTSAPTPFGKYILDQDFRISFPTGRYQRHMSEGNAKAAAQADYTARILSALKGTP